MVKILSAETNISIQDLLITYGEHMFGLFKVKYSDLLEGIENPIDFLAKVDDYIHVEVQKLYPDAELPKFEILKRSENYVEMTYMSVRKLSDFAHGLINGCAAYYNVNLIIKKTDVNGDGTKVKFQITLA